VAPGEGGGELGPALIVEDNVIIALEIEAFLQDHGVATCYLAGTVENALLLLEAREIAFAVVDVDLGGESSEEVALVLTERGLPFLFATGYGDTVPVLQRFPAVPVLRKPFTAATLYKMLEQVGI